MQKLQAIAWLFASAATILVAVGPQLYTSTGDISISSPVESGPPQVFSLAQVEPTAIDNNSIPTETPPPSTTDAYPAAQPSPASVETVSPYPAGTTAPDNNPPPFSIIGNEIESTTVPEAASTNQPASTQQALRGRLLLWSGFIVALLLFATSVAGAIVLFMRQRG